MKLQQYLLLAILALTFSFLPAVRYASAEKKGTDIKLARGKLSMKASADWTSKKPAFKIIDHEFSIPAVKDDKVGGRLTIMGAGGSIEQNINRWIGQFSQPDGKSTKDRTTIDTLKIAGQTVYLVNITGNFNDRRAGLQKDYRMIAAIIVTEKLGQHFIKLYGPKQTIAANEKKFKSFLDSLKVN